jgi:hypothetical protein
MRRAASRAYHASSYSGFDGAERKRARTMQLGAEDGSETGRKKID